SDKRTSSETTASSETATVSASCSSDNVSGPTARMNASMVIKQGILYLYGGIKELTEKKQITLGDFYCLNLHKMDAWKTLHVDLDQQNVHIYSDSESSGDEEGKTKSSVV
ncbi:unnamed protein product, partial [Didymodactylos carnosus]